MPIKKKDSLDQQLGKWKVSIDGDPELVSHVLNRIAAEKTPSFPSRFTPLLRWGAGLAAAAILMVSVFMVSRQLERKRVVREGTYFLMIDPVSRVRQEAGAEVPSADDSLIERLAWMQDALDLSQEQFLGLVDLHMRYSVRFDKLYEELVRLNGRFAEFEGLRKQNEMIDFIALYEVLKERRDAEDNSYSLSREFVANVTSLLRPDQRATYLSLVQGSPIHPDA